MVVWFHRTPTVFQLNYDRGGSSFVHEFLGGLILKRRTAHECVKEPKQSKGPLHEGLLEPAKFTAMKVRLLSGG